MDSSRLTQPWFRNAAIYSTPRSLLLKLQLGEAPEAIPAFSDARCGAQDYAHKVDGGGPIDRVLSLYTQSRRVSRLHGAAASFSAIGQRHLRYNDVEQCFGLARTLRIDVEEGCNIGYLLNALRPLAVVEEAYPHYLCTLPFDQAVNLADLSVDAGWSARDRICAAEAAAYQPGDSAVMISVVDTGVALAHQELEGGMKRGYDSVNLGAGDLPAGLRLLGDSIGVDADPDDAVGHGTSCLGIIGGAGRHMPAGLAVGSSLLPVRALGSALFPGRRDPVGIGGCGDIDRGLKMAVDLGAKVINCSFGSPVGDLDAGDPIPHRDVVEYALSRGCILVAASGNSGLEQSFSPACLDGVLAVGAVDDEGLPTRFSTSGAHVALCAPGDRVLSCGLEGYALVTGTSFAAPFVTATCALMVARALARGSPLDGSAARGILMSSSTPFARGVEGKHGAGILNALAALKALDNYLDGTGGHEFAYSDSGRKPQFY